ARARSLPGAFPGRRRPRPRPARSPARSIRARAARSAGAVGRSSDLAIARDPSTAAAEAPPPGTLVGDVHRRRDGHPGQHGLAVSFLREKDPATLLGGEPAHLRLLFPAPPVHIPQCVCDRRSTFSWAMPSLSRIALRRASSRSAAAACCLRRMSPNTTQASSKLRSPPVFMDATLQLLPGPPSHRPRLARTPRCIRSSSSRVAMILHVGARRGGFQTVRFLKLSSHTSNLTAAGSLVSPLNSHLKDQDENRSA